MGLRAALTCLLASALVASGCGPGETAMDAGTDAPRADVPLVRDAPLPVDAPPDAPPPTCSPADCDDTNACTSDVCVDGTCQHSAVAGACDDGVYCNGADSCDAGTCSVHAGEPCTAPTVCNEPEARCDGCGTEADCPGGGSISGTCTFTSVCATTGTRTDTTYECTDGACVGTDVDVACDRTTEDDACGDVVVTPGACMPPPGMCNESGNQTTTTVTPTCHAGACAPDTTNATTSCVLDRDGEECGVTGCSDWSPCMSPLPACMGIHTRMCARRTCMDGACVLESAIESEECFLDGAPCDGAPPFCGDCTPTSCSSGGACSMNCMVQAGACSAGACVPSGPSTPICMACACP